MIFTSVIKFASEHNYKVLAATHQNHYPYITFITEDNEKIVVDLKSISSVANDFTFLLQEKWN